MTAPERIWATEDAENFGQDRFHTTRPMSGLTEYIRADLEQEIVAEAVRAEREACAKVAHDAGKPYARAFIMRRLAGLGYNISVRSKQRMCVRIAAAIRARGEG